MSNIEALIGSMIIFLAFFIFCNSLHEFCARTEELENQMTILHQKIENLLGTQAKSKAESSAIKDDLKAITETLSDISTVLSLASSLGLQSCKEIGGLQANVHRNDNTTKAQRTIIVGMRGDLSNLLKRMTLLNQEDQGQKRSIIASMNSLVGKMEVATTAESRPSTYNRPIRMGAGRRVVSENDILKGLSREERLSKLRVVSRQHKVSDNKVCFEKMSKLNGAKAVRRNASGMDSGRWLPTSGSSSGMENFRAERTTSFETPLPFVPYLNCRKDSGYEGEKEYEVGSARVENIAKVHHDDDTEEFQDLLATIRASGRVY